jgi:hypothetical protein
MTDSIDPNLSDIFNARDLSAGDVASGFIAPPAFKRLLSQAHCVLEGPRGSGKTTLLRMLTPESFALWKDVNTDEHIHFIGIFVPADVRWAKQLKSRLSRVLDPLASEAIQQTVFSVAVSLALVETIEICSKLSDRYATSHPSLFFSMPRETQAAIVEALAGLWQLKITVASFNGLRLALRTRQHELGGIGLKLATGTKLSDIQNEHPYIAALWLDNIVTAVETLNDILERPEQRWAVLLDELEIIPNQLLKSIVEALRSTSPKLRFKLALSPTGSDLLAVGDMGAPSPTNDYRPVPLWYEGRDEARVFSDQLFRSALSRMISLPQDQPLNKILLGSQEVTIGDGDEVPVEEVGNQNTAAKRERISTFVSLYGKDESFKRLLDSKQIDPSNPHTSDSSDVGTLVRKITTLVYLRDREIERFEMSVGRSVRKGGRRGLQPYIGYPNLIDLTEGNPRWILTLAEGLAAQSKKEGIGIDAQGVQSKAVDDFVEQFVAKLMVYPTGTVGTRPQTTPFQFVELLGESIATVLYDGPFSTDPRMSFTIDQHAMNQYGEYIRTCIDLGALVIMRRDSATPLGADTEGLTLVGSRVRITYRLAPRFRLPLRAQKERKLSNALKSGELLKPRQDTGSHSDNTSAEKTSKTPIQGRLL